LNLYRIQNKDTTAYRAFSRQCYNRTIYKAQSTTHILHIKKMIKWG